MTLAYPFASVILFLSVIDSGDWRTVMLQYGVCGIWIIWFHFALQAQIKRDDKRHEDNQRLMRQHTEGLANISLLLVSTLEEISEFSPTTLRKIITNAQVQAQEAIRESRDDDRKS